jgi:hypothetical protein
LARGKRKFLWDFLNTDIKKALRAQEAKRGIVLRA